MSEYLQIALRYHSNVLPYLHLILFLVVSLTSVGMIIMHIAD